ncbi:MAG: leucyl/phenylalanyl-tRNA--protein transferase [Chitinophagales bacterium]
MPIFQLGKDLVFPNPKLAEDGILAIGGDLCPERLLLAYTNGIFPWYNKGEPIIWHAPNPRFVLYPSKFKMSKSLKSLYNKGKYKITFNQDFESVIKNCQQVDREFQEDTWITNDMFKAYCQLHKLGFAKSVEVYNKDHKLVGGLYGVHIGDVFFGESMFHLESNTSKLAFAYLIQHVKPAIIDCQVHTEHLESLGGEHISLAAFQAELDKNMKLK